MPAFTDAQGRAWVVEINVTSLNRVKRAMDVDLARLATAGDLFQMLADDPLQLCNVLYLLCKPQLEKANVSDEEFGRALAGDAIDDAAKALIEGLIDFFPKRRRPVLKKALAKLEETEKAALAKAETEIDEMKATPSSSASNSQDSSE